MRINSQVVSVVSLLACSIFSIGCVGDGDGDLDAGAPFLCVVSSAVELRGVSADDCDKITGFSLPATLPPARGNAVADDPDAALFGLDIFYDARFSSNVDVRCASCHLPELEFVDSEPTSIDGVGIVSRNSPTTLNAARHTVFFWAGRADSLWSQPLFALEAENEMDFTRLEVAHNLNRLYREDYENVFGSLPDLDDTARFPAVGKPGDLAWEEMTEADQIAVNVVFANIGKALEAFMRRSTGGPTSLDVFLDGDKDALSLQEVQGLRVFATAGCITCHSGPLLSDERYYNIGLPDDAAEPDQGRAVEATVVLDNEFSLFGVYADSHNVTLPTPATLQSEAASEEAMGAFRTPSLRHIGRTAPYGHHGTMTLSEIVDHQLSATATAPIGTMSSDLKPQSISDDDRAALLAFLLALDSDSPLPPWNDWPER